MVPPHTTVHTLAGAASLSELARLRLGAEPEGAHYYAVLLAKCLPGVRRDYRVTQDASAEQALLKKDADAAHVMDELTHRLAIWSRSLEPQLPQAKARQ